MPRTVSRTIGEGVLELTEGDITLQRVDAIVNAANSALQLGAGVAGAIRRRGGPSIQAECDRIGHCPVGGAVVTGGGNLLVKQVIHAVGPVWGNQDDEESDRLLASACREALERGRENGLREIALPSLSTGIFGFPLERAAEILLSEAAAHLRSSSPVHRVIFCLFGNEAFDAFETALRKLPL